MKFLVQPRIKPDIMRTHVMWLNEATWAELWNGTAELMAAEAELFFHVELASSNREIVFARAVGCYAGRFIDAEPRGGAWRKADAVFVKIELRDLTSS